VNAIAVMEKEMMKKKVPDFRTGDMLKVHIRVKEGDKTRIQIFEGRCIGRRGKGAGASFSVIKETHGNIVEKTFALYSPVVEKIVIGRTSKKKKVRRSKLYHLRSKK